MDQEETIKYLLVSIEGLEAKHEAAMLTIMRLCDHVDKPFYSEIIKHYDLKFYECLMKRYNDADPYTKEILKPYVDELQRPE